MSSHETGSYIVATVTQNIIHRFDGWKEVIEKSPHDVIITSPSPSHHIHVYL